MKKLLAVSFVLFMIAVSYSVYANTMTSLYANLGCDDDPRIECRSWIVTPNGVEVVKESGINSMSLEEPGGKE